MLIAVGEGVAHDMFWTLIGFFRIPAFLLFFDAPGRPRPRPPPRPPRGPRALRLRPLGPRRSLGTLLPAPGDVTQLSLAV